MKITALTELVGLPAGSILRISSADGSDAYITNIALKNDALVYPWRITGTSAFYSNSELITTFATHYVLETVDLGANTASDDAEEETEVHPRVRARLARGLDHLWQARSSRYPGSERMLREYRDKLAEALGITDLVEGYGDNESGHDGDSRDAESDAVTVSGPVLTYTATDGTQIQIDGDDSLERFNARDRYIFSSLLNHARDLLTKPARR